MRDEFRGEERTTLVQQKHQTFGLAGKSIGSTTKYQILDQIGVGGMGEVYKGKMNCEANIGKTVALKFIREGLDEEMYQKFLWEASLTMLLEHENIINVINLESYLKQTKSRRHKRIYFMVMQHIDGPDLGRLHSEHYVQKYLMPVDFTAFIISRMCRALHYAHTKSDENGQFLGIVHLDISPENILMNSQGVCKLTDFGIAKAFHATDRDERQDIGGKPLFMSPEQMAFLLGRNVVIDRRSDIFSLGMVAYKTLTGLHPYKPREKMTNFRDAIKHISAAMKHEIVPPHKICPGIPENLSEIIIRALQTLPESRYETAQAMGLDLEKNYLYKDRFGPTNDSMQQYLQAFNNNFKSLESTSRKKKLSEAMPFLRDRKTGEFNPVRMRSYYRDVVQKYKAGLNPCLVES